jgi:hypothetical protein
MKDQKGHGSDADAQEHHGRSNMESGKGWTKEQAESFLHSEGHVTDVGQMNPQSKRHLDKLVKSGNAHKGEDPYFPGRHAVWSLVKPLPGYIKGK